MKIKKLNIEYFIVSITKTESYTLQAAELIKYLLKQSDVMILSKTNFKVPMKYWDKVNDFNYFPFTKKEYLDGELEFLKFMAQFDPVEL